MILNLRGAGGSGKTELARRIIRRYGPLRAAGTPGSGGPDIGLAHHPGGGRPLAVVGSYERQSGGCDTVRKEDGGLPAVLEAAARWCAEGCDVLLEGNRLSREVDGTGALAGQRPLTVLQLSTPPALCAAQLRRRRRLALAETARLLAAAEAEAAEVEAACRALAERAEVLRLGFDEALGAAVALLDLPVGGDGVLPVGDGQGRRDETRREEKRRATASVSG